MRAAAALSEDIDAGKRLMEKCCIDEIVVDYRSSMQERRLLRP
jgi:hypothetical protein